MKSLKTNYSKLAFLFLLTFCLPVMAKAQIDQPVNITFFSNKTGYKPFEFMKIHLDPLTFEQLRGNIGIWRSGDSSQAAPYAFKHKSFIKGLFASHLPGNNYLLQAPYEAGTYEVRVVEEDDSRSIVVGVAAFEVLSTSRNNGTPTDYGTDDADDGTGDTTGNTSDNTTDSNTTNPTLLSSSIYRFSTNATKEIPIKVGKSVQIKVSATSRKKVGKKYNVVNVTNTSTYKSNNPKIATVSNTGQVKGIKKGKTTVTAYYGKFHQSISVNVR